MEDEAAVSGMSVEEFFKEVLEWTATAQHPRFKRPYTDLVYEPMLELMRYLRSNQFKTYIVSGGGIEFMRPWTEKMYSIPPEQVVGSSGVTKFELKPNGSTELLKLPKVEFIDDGPGKPVGINRFIGHYPISPSATRTATCRCCNGLPRTPGRASWASCTAMPSANTRMTAIRASSGSTRRWTKRKSAAGPW
jgi:hypothetical protein